MSNDESKPTNRGLVLIADGIGGLDVCARSLRWVLNRRNLPLELHHLKWGHGVGRWHRDLTRTGNVERRSAEAAEVLLQYREQYKDLPIYLIGKSGGSGVVVRALERLPQRTVDRTILLAPALSPQYDLSKALSTIRNDLVVYYSTLDWMILGVGTSLFGTIDRVHGPGAGLVGFQSPTIQKSERDRVSTESSGQIRAIRWHPGMVRAGYLGGHFTIDWPPFLSRYVVPLLQFGPLD